MSGEAWKLLREIYDRHRDIRYTLDDLGQLYVVKGTEARAFTEHIGEMFDRASPELQRALRTDDPSRLAS